MRSLPAPTQAPPGSPEKIAIMTQRFAANEELYHPSDAVGDPPPRTARLQASLDKNHLLPSCKTFTWPKTLFDDDQ